MAVTVLSAMTVGQKGKIQSLGGDDIISQRLLELGLIPGSPVEVVRFAPMGDPMDLKVRGYHLSLRRQEASTVWVELTDR